MKFVIEHLEKHFDKKEVLKDINFAFEEKRMEEIFSWKRAEYSRK